MFINNGNLFVTLYKTQRAMETASKRLSTGLRINSAKDDPAGLAIATRLKKEINSLHIGSDNIKSARSMIEVADQGASTIQTLLKDMRDLALQADNSTLSTADKQSLQTKFLDLKAEYVKTTTKTTYNEITLLNNSNTYRVNTGNGGTLTVKMQNMTSSSGGTIDIEDIDLTLDAQGALSKIDNTSAEISKIRADFGSQLNAMDYREDFNENLSLAYEESRSRIEDADMAKEMSELTKNQILHQTNLQMLQQYSDLNTMFLLLFEK